MLLFTPHFQHQLIICRVWFKFFYPFPYERPLWHFSQTNSDQIKRAIDLFDWESTLIDLDFNEQVSGFNGTITNIMSDFVPNKVIIYNDRDRPWMNCHVKNLILYKDNYYKSLYVEKNSMLHLLTFNNLQNHLNQFIQKLNKII